MLERITRFLQRRLTASGEQEGSLCPPNREDFPPGKTGRSALRLGLFR